MYSGRDMTELTMVPKQQWTDEELSHFHQSLQQITPYLNSEGASIRNAIVKEIQNRGELYPHNSEHTHGIETLNDLV